METSKSRLSPPCTCIRCSFQWLLNNDRTFVDMDIDKAHNPDGITVDTEGPVYTTDVYVSGGGRLRVSRTASQRGLRRTRQSGPLGYRTHFSIQCPVHGPTRKGAIDAAELLIYYPNAWSRSSIRSSGFSSPTDKRSRFSGTLVPGPSTDARCSIKLSTPPRLVALVKSFARPATDMASAPSPFT